MKPYDDYAVLVLCAGDVDRAATSIERAKLLAEKRSTADEREYIEALSARYSSDEKPDYDKLAIAYREAMRGLVHAHPNDADAAALYAEAIMDLHPWQLWSNDGKPGPDTTELVELLESDGEDETCARVDVRLVNQDGQPTVTGSAVVITNV